MAVGAACTKSPHLSQAFERGDLIHTLECARDLCWRDNVIAVPGRIASRPVVRATVLGAGEQ